jgi:bifunctional oligoribonuclease and PAP phosphatase NrnA
MSKPQPDTIAEIITSIQFSQRFLVATHIRPDGDAVGSLLSMAHMLRQLGKQADPYCNDPAPVAYRFLPGVHTIRDRVSQPFLYEVAILVDCAEFLRVGSALAEAIHQVPFLITIDHHVSHATFGNIFWNNTSASSACEMLYDLCLRLPLSIEADLATTLYTGLLTDSGSFRFSNTNQRVLEIAANLVAAGADPAYIAEQVYDSATVQSLRLLAGILATLSFSADDRLATAEMTQEMFFETAASPSDAEGFINFLRSVKSVEMAMLFREGTDGKIHVSMRSKGSVDVAGFARRHGGGGHRHAAAFEIEGTLEAIRSHFSNEALTYLEQPVGRN